MTQELGITNTQYSLLQAAVSLVNTVVPLFGGQFIDVFGTGWGSIMASTLILVGNIIVALSTEVASYPIMVLGRLVYGYARRCPCARLPVCVQADSRERTAWGACGLAGSVGAGCIVTVQEAILAHWFHGRGLAIAVGLQISMSRLVRCPSRRWIHRSIEKRRPPRPTPPSTPHPPSSPPLPAPYTSRGCTTRGGHRRAFWRPAR